MLHGCSEYQSKQRKEETAYRLTKYVLYPVVMPLPPVPGENKSASLEGAARCVLSTMMLGNWVNVPRTTVVSGCRINTNLFMAVFQKHIPSAVQAKDEESNDILRWTNFYKEELTIRFICYEETKTKSLIGCGIVFQSPLMFTNCLLLNFQTSVEPKDRYVTFDV